ncbi:MAG: hypothetical protein Q9222_006610 [Ikaeria aurantiellina]
MDINSLLSPQDSPRDESAISSSKPAPKKTRRPRAAKPTVPAKISPSTTSSYPSPAPPQNLNPHPHQQIIYTPPMAQSTSIMRSAPENVADGSRPARQGSTPGMDTLAELASMQQHQQATRESAGGLRSTEVYENQSSANGSVLSQLHGVHNSVPQRVMLDHTMVDAPPQTAPLRTITSKALSDTELQAVEELVKYLSANQFAYYSHIQLINLLHRGLLSHTQGGPSPTFKNDPGTYELLTDLRNAREAMETRFSVGEELWAEWIQDEQLLARTFDECIAVMELCQKSAREEAGSTKLWSMYARWTTSLYLAATSDDGIREAVEDTHEIQHWSDEDKIVAAEVCSWQQMMDVWARGVKDTKCRIDDSHLLWDPYTELLLQDLARAPSSDGIAAMKSHFLDRLQTPHATWDGTFQMFSNFISSYENHSYEQTMMTVNDECTNSKATYGAREMMELAVRKAHGSGNQDAVKSAFHEYIEWELSQSRRKHAFVFELVDALYQRAVLRFPADTELWEGYVMFLNEEIVSHSRPDVDLLPVLDRSTKHCPWSGSLWSQYLLAAERQKIMFPEIGQIKHKATSTGLLDAGGLEEVLQVYVAWCSILRRRAFQDESTDEELDVAEVGIRSAIEDMQRLGEAKYNKEYQGDPNYRLERIYIKYLTQSRNWHAARESWKSLISSRGDSHEFWLRYYLWEMSVWGKISYSEISQNGPSSPRPSEATKVLRSGLKRPNLDWPERLIQILQYHCEDHEDATELQSATIQIWKAKKVVQKRREKEALEAYEAAKAQSMRQVQTLNAETSADSAVSFTTSKRKREDNSIETSDGGISKKTRVNEQSENTTVDENPSATSSELKRDRENATIVVRNLPKGTTETRVRQYFKDCGAINNLILAPEGSDGATMTATIEFESQEDALTAQTKDKKDLNGQEIEVQIGSGSTVFVANFPPTADEKWIKNTFEEFGQIIDIRLPSLQHNTHRRFCYVQFSTAAEAKDATKLDGRIVDRKLRIVAKISDPSRRQNRTGATEEGREIYIRNLDWAVTESELKAAFSRYGAIEKTRIPTDVSGRSKGYAFLEFSKKEEATAALAMNDSKLKHRVITVEVASKAGNKRQAITIIDPKIRSTASPSPDVSMTNGDHSAQASPGPTANVEAKPTSEEIRARTFALLNVPDTVNDARIRALAEPYGPMVKVVLRPDHQGAILEFKNVGDAGKAALGLDGYEITPGRSLATGSVSDMFQQNAEIKNARLASTSIKKPEASSMLQGSTMVRRPAQLGAKRGGRGGLALTAKGPGKGIEKKADTDPNKNADARDGGQRSNADFKAMFLGKDTNA